MAENSLSSPHSQKRKMSIFKWRTFFFTKKKQKKKIFFFGFSAFRSKHSSILVRNTRRLGYKSKILVSLEVLMTKRHHF